MYGYFIRICMFVNSGIECLIVMLSHTLKPLQMNSYTGYDMG